MTESAGKSSCYREVLTRIQALLDGESDEIAIMATVACELHNSMAHFDWTGFYRVTAPGMLTIGPYQGGHGCLRIPFTNGICGRTARTGQTVIINDVNQETDHIACATSTVSEIVVSLKDPQGRVFAVLDVDSNTPAAFDSLDKTQLEAVCKLIEQALSPHRAV